MLLPGKLHGRRSLVGHSPWGCEASDTTERLHFHFSLSCVGEGNGNPLQCSCPENPREGGAWWAAVYGVTQSRTRLKRLSSSSRVVLKVRFQTSYSRNLGESPISRLCHSSVDQRWSPAITDLISSLVPGCTVRIMGVRGRDLWGV